MKFTAAACAMLITTSAAMAQDARPEQSAVLGASDDAVYALRIEGSNGVIYNCKNDTTVIDGTVSRECIREGQAPAAGGDVFASGEGIAAPLAAGLGVIVLAVALDDGSSSTTTTPSNGGSDD
ncbi:hypothetical protein [Sulfitobacter sp. S190]|uniref:hypothetical protein n=1 Tax=Sulfitobacter sp. S190 TaxID=2867022 RepID=UPI0021A7C502|nr:hypothetical protein [Sulfitobacter sp. S190]UWR24006.1 hypothetical protein K3756_08670 [Sulfitobacter sp. S190]